MREHDSCIRLGCGVRAGAGAVPRRARRATPRADVARLQAEVARLKQELRDQRQLMLQLMQAEQQRYDMHAQVPAGGRRRRARTFRRCRRPPSPSSCRCRPKRGGDRGEPRKDAAGRGTRRQPSRARCAPAAGARRGLRLRRRACAPARAATPSRSSSSDKQFSPRVAGGAGWARSWCSPTRTPSSTTSSRPRPATRSTSDRSRAARRRRRWCCSSPGPSRSSATSTRRCARTCWWSPTATGRAWPPTARSRCRACRSGTRKVVLWSPTLKPVSQQVDVTPKGGDGDVHVGGDVGPAAPQQARPGLRFIR